MKKDPQINESLYFIEGLLKSLVFPFVYILIWKKRVLQNILW
jgi:hypothetical protein